MRWHPVWNVANAWLLKDEFKEVVLPESDAKFRAEMEPSMKVAPDGEN
jgi:hypothetical protein